jgi:hypothetical protein
VFAQPLPKAPLIGVGDGNYNLIYIPIFYCNVHSQFRQQGKACDGNLVHWAKALNKCQVAAQSVTEKESTRGNDEAVSVQRHQDSSMPTNQQHSMVASWKDW